MTGIPVSGGAAGSAAAAAIVQAIKASGVLVRLEPREFAEVLRRIEAPLVVTATGGFFSTNYQYLTGYKGLAFFTKSSTPLDLPPSTEVVQARKIWIPG